MTICKYLLNGKESSCHCRRKRRCGLDPWVGKIPRNRKWQPTPVFLPRKSNGQWNLAGCSPWGCKESNMTEQTVYLGVNLSKYWKEWQGQSRREENQSVLMSSLPLKPTGTFQEVRKLGYLFTNSYHWMGITHGALTTWNFQSASYAIQATFADREAPLAKTHRNTSMQMTFGRAKRIWVWYQESLLQQKMGPSEIWIIVY